jgi:hypothetical protein
MDVPVNRHRLICHSSLETFHCLYLVLLSSLFHSYDVHQFLFLESSALEQSPRTMITFLNQPLFCVLNFSIFKYRLSCIAFLYFNGAWCSCPITYRAFNLLIIYTLGFLIECQKGPLPPGSSFTCIKYWILALCADFFFFFFFFFSLFFFWFSHLLVS